MDSPHFNYEKMGIIMTETHFISKGLIQMFFFIHSFWLKLIIIIFSFCIVCHFDSSNIKENCPHTLSAPTLLNDFWVVEEKVGQ